ncbi:hypothetical protein BT63DRAFT_422136 [Microthyrium microscopicum]|uniref:Uncharacterized protein n=1 Tax=Microthyrium microscopicum TaxID=703497 RepID=A0A6A6UIR6_9PEZI|nr:hypothetical protein BT63DRAFT_422136 [Microthyrium microscopicum]
MRFSVNSVLGASSCLLALTHALPTPQENSCDASSQFYVCSLNNFHGCCSVDPCALTSGCPDGQSTPSTNTGVSQSTCSPGTKAFKQFSPTMYTIGVDNPDSTNLHVENTTSTNSHTEQVFTFANVPSTATKIGMGWAASKSITEFVTIGSATGEVYLLDPAKLDFTTLPLTSDAVTAAIDPSNPTVGGAGFGAWGDTKSYPLPQTHIITAAGIENHELLAFKISLRDQGNVKLAQTGQDGLYLQYDC